MIVITNNSFKFLGNDNVASHGAEKPGLYIAGASGWVLSALPHCRRLMGRAKAWPAPCILYIAGLPGTTSPARASREQAPLRSRQAPGQPHTSDQAIARWDSSTGRPLGQPCSLVPSAQCLQLGTWHAPSAPMPSGWPSPLTGQPGSVCTQAWQQRCRSPWWPPLWLAGRAQLEACVLACPGATSAHGLGAPGTYKGEFGAAKVSSNLGVELTAAPWRSPRNFVPPLHTL